ncbi:NnrU family protein [Congregibacter brevis]|uniref:NnrU family protein n=1 Tax=Congregibacter brevis TaxID=3081201 RepID=A0ABZ0IAA5_9GAMM|nr:NnrU family protein [Congregibacter sp. IMCC45268]
MSLAPSKVSAAKEKMGENGIKSLITVFTVAGMVLIVLGWRGSESTWLYTTPSSIRGAATGLVVLALYLFVVSNRPSAIKRFIRHPQLSGVLVWAVAHLLLNGDSRSLLLFGGMGLWAILEILLINRRDPAPAKPSAPGLISEMITVAITLAVAALIVWAHPWLAGVPAIASF